MAHKAVTAGRDGQVVTAHLDNLLLLEYTVYPSVAVPSLLAPLCLRICASCVAPCRLCAAHVFAGATRLLSQGLIKWIAFEYTPWAVTQQGEMWAPSPGTCTSGTVCCLKFLLQLCVCNNSGTVVCNACRRW